jgi:hypothetical protein
MRVHAVDPRDTRWEVDRPCYRVYFWRRAGDRPDSGWESEDWQVEGADVGEVLAWADRDRAHRAHTLYVCCECNGEPGLIRLAGRDPTADS